MQKSIDNQPKIKVLGRLNIKGLDIIKRVYSAEGLAPTLSTMGGQRQPKVIVRRNHE